ncbi:DUF3854 domain-containing protein [Demequina capsici]|uniref:DUF3854 domain-containing protein n=1 Tax=Demequina capsici TaxID=3075620 RepID=A0AA96JCW4_9MICO|nr:DUF3854 domain-containing protein [Demequina sp. PMTSA13]WNM27346.1 DUF3854 domain-containing protein [Demequina sp. PMTSA13]
MTNSQSATGPQTPLISRHQKVLEDSAISIEAAQAWGIRSIVDDADLPDGLKTSPLARSGVPGMLFPLRTLDGRVLWQLRADNPPKDDQNNEHKYIQQAKVGSIINIPEMMERCVGQARTVLIVEGTKQTIAVCQYVDEDTLVIGVQGCANWSASGIIHADLMDAVKGAQRVDVLFDADVAKNTSVFDAATNLKRQLSVMAGIDNVKFIRLSEIGGFSAKAGIDDVLGSLPSAQRAELLATLRSKATDGIGRRPAEKKPTKKVSNSLDPEAPEIEIRMHEGRTVEVTTLGSGDTVTDQRYALAALITREENVETEYNGSFDHQYTTYTVEIAVEDEQGRVRSKEITVNSKKFDSPNDWIDMAGSLTTSVPRFVKPSEGAEFANLIRAASSGRVITRRIERLGWVFDTDDPEHPQWRWLHPSGSIGVTDVNDGLTGAPQYKGFDSVKLPNPHTTGKSACINAIRQFLGVRDLLKPGYEVAWEAAIGAFGLSFLPVPPQVALAYFGRKSSGKSTLAQALAATLTPEWGPKGTAMMTFNATQAAMDRVSAGVTDCFMHVDDLKPEKDARRRATVLEMVDDLLRRAHNSGGRVRAGFDHATGNVYVNEKDTSTPMVIITGEEIPTGGDFAESALDRMFIVNTPEGGMMAPEPKDDGKFDTGQASLNSLYARLGEFPLVTSAYVAWLANLIMQASAGPDAAAGGETQSARATFAIEVENWSSEIAEMIHEQLRKVAGVNATHRAVLGAARLVAGASYFLRFAQETGAITPDESTRLADAIFEHIVAQLIRNTNEVMDNNQTAGESILDELRSHVSSGLAVIDNRELSGRQVRIGQRGTFNGVEVLHIGLQATQRLLSYPTGWKGVQRALEEYAQEGSGTRPAKMHQARIGGTRVRALSIPLDLWNEDVDPCDAEREVSM